MLASLLALAPLTAAAAGLDAPTPAPTAASGAVSLQSASVYVFADDPGAREISARAADAIARRAQSEGWRVVADPRVADLLDRPVDDLVRSADALAIARAAFRDGLEQNSRLRLDAAQEALQRARASLLDAGAAPDYVALRQVHLYMGIVLLNLGQPDDAQMQFRQAVFLAPNFQLNRDQFPPSVQEAFAQAKKEVATASKGSLRIEVDGTKNAFIVFDGDRKGAAPKTLTDLAEGEHYLEVRGPGMSPQLLAVNVLPGLETPTIVTARPCSPLLRSFWTDSRAAAGAAAAARILDVDRLIIGAARSTVTGVSPFILRAAAFDAALGRRAQVAETSAARDLPTTDQRLQRFAQQLFRPTPVDAVGGGANYAALVATRDRFLERDSALLSLEVGGAQMDHMFDAHAFVPTTRDDEGNFNRDRGFKKYSETRAVLRLRYGMRERVTLVAEIPLLSKQMDFVDDNGDSVKRKSSGLGDIQVGADVRIPTLETPRLRLAYIATRIKLPSGDSTTPRFFRRNDKLIMGTGQYDIYAGMGGLVASGDMRFGVEGGYLSHLPDRVNWIGGGQPQFLNIGDEEHFHADGAEQLTRILAPEVSLDFTHRHATKGLQDPISHDPLRAREMYLVQFSAGIRAFVTERSEAGASLQHPLWGRATKTLFPVDDITGPRLTAYYAIRF